MFKSIAIIGCLYICLVSSDDPFNPPTGMTPIDMLMKAVPGTPGEDYPIYNEVPETSFNCNDKVDGGYYVDVEARCQTFHICTRGGHHPYRNNLVAYSFLCPNGSLFSQQYFICDWWFNVDCSASASFYYLNDDLFIDRAQLSTSSEFDEIRTKSQKFISQSERKERKNNGIDTKTINFPGYESNTRSSYGQKLGDTLTNRASSTTKEYETNYPSKENQKTSFDTKVFAQFPSSYDNKPLPGSSLKLDSNRGKISNNPFKSNRAKISNNSFKSSLKSASPTNTFHKNSFQSNFKTEAKHNSKVRNQFQVNSEFDAISKSKSKSRNSFDSQGQSNFQFTTPSNTIKNSPLINLNEQQKLNHEQRENFNVQTIRKNNLNRLTKENKKNTSFQGKKNNFSYKEKSNSHIIKQKQSSVIPNQITQYPESTKDFKTFPSITSNRNPFEVITKGSNQFKSQKYEQLNLNKVNSSPSKLSGNQRIQSLNSQKLFDSHSERIVPQQSFNFGKKVTQSSKGNKRFGQKNDIQINTISNPSLINSVKYVTLSDTRRLPTNQVKSNSGSTEVGNERQNFIESTYFKTPGTKLKIINTLNRQKTNGINTSQLKLSTKESSSIRSSNVQNNFNLNGDRFSISSGNEKSNSKSNFFKNTSSSIPKKVSPVIIKFNVTPKVNFVQFKKVKGASSGSLESANSEYSNQNQFSHETFKSKTSLESSGNKKSFKVDSKVINPFKAEGIAFLSRGNAHSSSIYKNATSSNSNTLASSTFSPIQTSSSTTLSISSTPSAEIVLSQNTPIKKFSSRGNTISFGKDNKTFSNGQIFHVSKGTDIHQPTHSTQEYDTQKSFFTSSKLDTSSKSTSTVSQSLSTTTTSPLTLSGSLVSFTTPTTYKSSTTSTTFYKPQISSTQLSARTLQENKRLQDELIPSNQPRASPLISEFADSSFVPLFNVEPLEKPSQLYGVPLAEPIVIKPKEKEASIEIPSLLYGVPLAEPIKTPSLIYGVPLAEPLSIPVKVPSKTYGPPLAEPIGFTNDFIVDEPPPPPPSTL